MVKKEQDWKNLINERIVSVSSLDPSEKVVNINPDDLKSFISKIEAAAYKKGMVEGNRTSTHYLNSLSELARKEGRRELAEELKEEYPYMREFHFTIDELLKKG